MRILDFVTRFIFIPGILIFILLCFIPEVIKDVKEWKQLLIQDGSKVKMTKKKTVQNTGATVYANSLSYSNISKYSTDVILSHK